ncbi:hypothetical protein BGZ60DRAFT_22449 [Tricladium varicosporioides]|nr:hypothetical protein BGZ60DRAFT_22449 [Hymenoscyphus varicosporioides]
MMRVKRSHLQREPGNQVGSVGRGPGRGRGPGSRLQFGASLSALLAVVDLVILGGHFPSSGVSSPSSPLHTALTDLYLPFSPPLLLFLLSSYSFFRPPPFLSLVVPPICTLSATRIVVSIASKPGPGDQSPSALVTNIDPTTVSPTNWTPIRPVYYERCPHQAIRATHKTLSNLTDELGRHHQSETAASSSQRLCWCII